MIIAIDLDKTLFNCNSVIYKFYNKLQEYKKLNKKLVYKTVLSHKEENVGFLKFFSNAFNPDKYVEIADAIPIIRSWKSEENIIIFLSSRPYNIKAVKNAAITWLSSHEVPYDSLILGCNNKGEFCKRFKVDLLIDDTLANCISASTLGIPAIYLAKTENTKHRKIKDGNDKLFFANNWNIVNIITTIIQKRKLQENKVINKSLIEKVDSNFNFLIENAKVLIARDIGLFKIEKFEKFSYSKNNKLNTNDNIKQNKDDEMKKL